ncbi:MAG: diguanylate cyclase [Planctomycetota bacterium]
MLGRKFDELRLTGSLPSPSAIGLRILELTKGEDHDQEQLVRTLQADPALSGRIIKIANSADRDGLPAVETVRQAAMRLGARAVRNVALGFSLVADNRRGRAPHFDYDAYWGNALACGVAAHLLAQIQRHVDPTAGFTCGLLCDVGKIALASVHPERYSEILAKHPGIPDAALARLESRAFGIDHLEVSAAMLADWGLPREYQEVALLRIRDDPSKDDSDDPDEDRHQLLALVRAGRQIARVLTGTWQFDDARWRGHFLSLEHLAKDLGLRHEALLALCDAILPSWREWGALIGVPVDCDRSFQDAASELERRGLRSARLMQLPADRAREAVEDGDTNLFNAELDTPLDMLGRGGQARGVTRVLLVDDDPSMLRLLRHHLEREGYEVLTAESSRAGMKLALDQVPQIVITDWMMPEMTGVELCSNLRRSQAGNKMYLIVVTARDDDEQVVEAFDAGADDYIVKPFNPRILIARVRAAQRMIQLRERIEDSERARLRQVAELGVMTRKLRAAALTDALTELPNRRYAMKRLKQEWESAQRTGRPLSVVMCDIDHFKRVNDEHGHDAGDVVLRETGFTLQSQLRASDVLCRLGGEEFLVIAVGADAEVGLQVAERLRKAVERHRIRYQTFDRAVTMSLGVALAMPGMRGIDDLIKASDEALYEAKAGGRNCVVLAGDDSGGPTEVPERRSA